MKYAVLVLMVAISFIRLMTMNLDSQIKILGFVLIVAFSSMAFLSLFLKQRARNKSLRQKKKPARNLKDVIEKNRREHMEAAKRAEKREAWISRMEKARNDFEPGDKEEEGRQ